MQYRLFHTKMFYLIKDVWNSMLLKIIIILLGIEKQHVRFIIIDFE
jgi:hypothetical protein